MGILSSIERRATIEDPSVPLSGASALLLDAWGGPKTSAGVQLSEQRALTFGAVWACVDLIAGILSSLPVDLLERQQPRGRRKLVEDPRYRVMRWKANPEISSDVLIKVMQAHKLTWGNAYAEKEFNGNGEVVGLWPLLPDRTRCERKDGRRWYFTRVKDARGEREIALPARNVLHLAGLGFDGLRGYSVIGMAMRAAVSVGMAADEFAARFYGSGMLTSGVLSHPQTLSTEAANRLKLDFEQRNSGLSMAHRLMVLEEGLKYERIGIPPEDAQFLGSRLFQRREVAGMYHVPPDMIGDLEHGGAYNSTEARAIAFRQQCLRTHAVDWERALGSQLLDDDELPTRYFAFNFNELERGELKARMEAYQIGRNMGVYSADDIREKEDEDPLPDGQGGIYLVPLNMVPADQVAKLGGGDGGGSSGDDEASRNLAQVRENRAALLLARTRRSWRGLFEAAFGKIVRREAKALRGMMRGGLHVAPFIAEVEAYHAGAFRTEASRDLLPAVDTLARLLREELTALYGETRAEASAVAADIVTEATNRMIAAAQGALRVALTEGADVEALLAEWETRRPGLIADSETPRICDDIANRFREEC